MKFLVFDAVLLLSSIGVLCQTSTQPFAYNPTDVATKPTTSTIAKEPTLKNDTFVCPGKNIRIPFFSLPCETRSDCLIFGSRMVCCSSRCIEGIPYRKDNNIFQTTIEKKPPRKNQLIERSSDEPTKVQIQNVEIRQVRNETSDLVCPNGVRIPFFSLLCNTHSDCSVAGEKMVCCQNRCIKGISSDYITPTVSTNKQVPERKATREISSASKNNVTNLNVITKETTINLVCPDKGVRIPFFSLPCSDNRDCSTVGKDSVCCSNRCIKGVPPKKPELVHSPSWFGLVDRNCPVDAIVEILEIKECETDADCRPRICCPDKYRSDGNKSYCRTPQPSLQRFPLADRATEPLRVFASYLQCTPPPPKIIDLFPKSCSNALDCFPNLCCQEGDKKYCRPPKRSILQLVAGLGQRFVPPDAAKKLIERLN